MKLNLGVLNVDMKVVRIDEALYSGMLMAIRYYWTYKSVKILRSSKNSRVY
jgi:hypothetical protein